MTRLFKIFLLIFTFSFFFFFFEDLVLKPPRAHCGKIVGFWDNDYTQEMGNPCWEGYIRYPDPRYPNGNVIISEYVKRELPGNGDYGIVVVNDISGNEKTFCVNNLAFIRKTIDNKFSGLGSIYCSNDLRSW